MSFVFDAWSAPTTSGIYYYWLIVISFENGKNKTTDMLRVDATNDSLQNLCKCKLTLKDKTYSVLSSFSDSLAELRTFSIAT